MSDLARRFAALDAISVPDLRSEIDRRAAASRGFVAPVSSWTVRSRGGRARNRRITFRPAAIVVVVVLAGALLAIGFSSSRKVDEVRPTPAPSHGAIVQPTEPIASDTPTPSAAGCLGASTDVHWNLPTHAESPVAAACSIWAIDWPVGTVLRVDPTTGATVSTLSLEVIPSSLTASGDAVWAAGRIRKDGQTTNQAVLLRIDPATNSVSQRIELPLDGPAPFFGRRVIGGASVDVVGHLGFVHTMMTGDPPIPMAVVDLDSGRYRGLITDGTAVEVGSDILILAGRAHGAGGLDIWKLDPASLKLTLIRDNPDLASAVVAAGKIVALTYENKVVLVSPSTGETTPVRLSFGSSDVIDIAAAGNGFAVLRGAYVSVAGEPKPAIEERELTFVALPSGEVVDRISLPTRAFAGLWTGFDRVWLRFVDGTVRTFPFLT